MTQSDDELVEAARKAREGAVCPHSGFAVGAALRDAAGTVWTGANVENASYTLGLCAERVALLYALTHGATAFDRIAIATEATAPTSPCGACRQLLWEFAPQATVIMVGAGSARLECPVAELLPHGFDDRSLK